MTNGLGQTIIDKIPKIMEELPKFLDKLGPYVEKIASFYNRPLPELTYRRLVDDMVTWKPNDGRIISAAAVKEIKDNGEIKVNVVYLDKNGNPIWDDGKNNAYSFGISARKIDAELERVFDGKKAIIFN